MGTRIIDVHTNIVSKNELPDEVLYVFKDLIDNESLSIYIHGSWADKTNIFFSDIDDFVIVDDSNTETYNETINILKKSEIRFARIDPLQHHGHWTVKRSDLDDYDDSFLPHYTINDALCLSGESTLNFKIKDELVEDKMHQYLLFTLYNIQLKNNKIKNGKLNAFEIKALASSYALIPALIYQTNGFQISKKDAIKRFLEENDPNLIKAFTWASEVRKNFGVIQKSKRFKLFSLLPYLTSSYEKWYQFSGKHSPSYDINGFDNTIQYNQDVSDAFALLCHNSIREKVIKTYSAEDCEKIVTRFVEELKSESNILNIYSFGEIKDPGISDVDMMLVTKNGCLQEAYAHILSVIKSDADYMYHFFHDPIIIEEQDVDTFTKIHSLNNITSLFARHAELKVENSEHDELTYLNWILFLLIYTYEVKENLVKFDERQIHHLLKNMAVSLQFTSPLSNELDRVKDIRKLALQDEFGKRELDKELISFYQKLSTASLTRFESLVPKAKTNKFLAGRYILFQKSNQIDIIKRGKKTMYCLPELLYDYSYDIIMNTNSKNKTKTEWQGLSKKYSDLGLPLMTVFPFHKNWFRLKSPSKPTSIKYLTLDFLAKLPSGLFWRY